MELFPQLYAGAVSAVVSEKQSTANTGLGREMRGNRPKKKVILLLFVTL